MPPEFSHYERQSMSVPEGVAKLFSTESAAESSPGGTGSAKETSSISSFREGSAPTYPSIVSGAALPATCGSTTPARSGVRLSASEKLKLETIRKNWDRGWLPLFEECRFLLELAERIDSL